MAPQAFSISADRLYLLLSHNVRKVYRHSRLAQYTVYDIVTSESYQLTPRNNNNRQLLVELREGTWPLLQVSQCRPYDFPHCNNFNYFIQKHASFGPRGHALLMVYNFNIYYTNGIKSIQTYRITNTGVPGVIFNGIADWLYEGEYTDMSRAILLLLN